MRKDRRTCAGKERAPIAQASIAECVPRPGQCRNARVRVRFACEYGTQPWCFTPADATSYSETHASKTATPVLAGHIAVAAVVVALIAAACSRGRQYELRGQILAVDPARQEITIKHEDIKGFMPGMTMPFKVRDRVAPRGPDAGRPRPRHAGRRGLRRVLTAIERTGHAPLTERPPARPQPMRCSPGDEVPDVELVDETGATRRLSEWRGRALAVTFIYTRCPLPDFCPLMDRQFADVQQIITDDADAARARAVACRSASIRRTTRRRPRDAREESRSRSRPLEFSDRRPARHRRLCRAFRRVHHARGRRPRPTSCTTSGPRSSTPTDAWSRSSTACSGRRPSSSPS